ncbi:MAG: hypothetical protein JSW13_00895, partial [Candidatus Aerophobus sp.]
RKRTDLEEFPEEPTDLDLAAERVAFAEDVIKWSLRQKIPRGQVYQKYSEQTLGYPDLEEEDFLELYDRYAEELAELPPKRTKEEIEAAKRKVIDEVTEEELRPEKKKPKAWTFIEQKEFSDYIKDSQSSDLNKFLRKNKDAIEKNELEGVNYFPPTENDPRAQIQINRNDAEVTLLVHPTGEIELWGIKAPGDIAQSLGSTIPKTKIGKAIDAALRTEKPTKPEAPPPPEPAEPKVYPIRDPGTVSKTITDLKKVPVGGAVEIDDILWVKDEKGWHTEKEPQRKLSDKKFAEEIKRHTEAVAEPTEAVEFMEGIIEGKTPTHFRSGMTRPADFEGGLRAGEPMAVTVWETDRKTGTRSKISSNMLLKISDALKDNPNTRIFIDSGAFSAFKAQKPLTNEEWDEFYRVTLMLSAHRPENVWYAVPDVVGDQTATIKLWKKRRHDIRSDVLRDMNVIAPFQRPKNIKERSPLALWNYIRSASMFDTNDIIVGIPSAVEALSPKDLKTLLQLPLEQRPKKFHLLGMGPTSRRYKNMIDTIREINPDAVITSDATDVRRLEKKISPKKKTERHIVAAEEVDKLIDRGDLEFQVLFRGFLTEPEVREVAEYLNQDPDKWARYNRDNHLGDLVDVLDDDLQKEFADKVGEVLEEREFAKKTTRGEARARAVSEALKEEREVKKPEVEVKRKYTREVLEKSPQLSLGNFLRDLRKERPGLTTKDLQEDAKIRRQAMINRLLELPDSEVEKMIKGGVRTEEALRLTRDRAKVITGRKQADLFAEPEPEAELQEDMFRRRSETPAESAAKIEKRKQDFHDWLVAMPIGTRFNVPANKGFGSLIGNWQRVDVAGDPFYKNLVSGDHKVPKDFYIAKSFVEDSLKRGKEVPSEPPEEPRPGLGEQPTVGREPEPTRAVGGEGIT